ncbi:LysR family transcriptional regulator [Nonomuraea sp. NPDC050394]|uniref:LysR family transcriptional regulator n=1 Tax=Nonomuraea sp. NPDC050394 TaxID=3364363 RepID=UPI0037A47EFE
MMDLRQFHVLRAIAVSGSLAGAARRLHYGQPTISYHLDALEAHLGARLVERGPTGAVLTDIGAMVLEHAADVLERIETVESDVAARLAHGVSTLRVGAFTTAATKLLPGPLRRATEGSDVRIELTEAEPLDLLTRLRARSLHCALIYDVAATKPGPVAATTPGDGSRAEPSLGLGVGPGLGSGAGSGHGAGAGSGHRSRVQGRGGLGEKGGSGVRGRYGADLRVRTLMDDPYRLLLPRGHALAAGEGPVDLGSLAGEGWIISSGSYDPSDQTLYATCQSLGFRPRIALRADNYSVIHGFVGAGGAVALVPELAFEQGYDVVSRPVLQDVGARGIQFVTPAGPRPAVVDRLSTELHRAYGGGAEKRGVPDHDRSL